MFAILVAAVLLVAAIGGVYWLLKSMGEEGIEAAAPGSCRSGRCGVQPAKAEGAEPQREHLQVVRIDEFKRKDSV